MGMGKDLAEKYPIARHTFEETDEALGVKLSRLCFEGPEDQLRLTENTQPAILTVSVAAWRMLDEKGIRPTFLAGHSLGEYSAHVAAGTISFADAVRTVRNRGKYMQEAVPVGTGSMAAILGISPEAVSTVCSDAAQGEVCEPANIASGVRGREGQFPRTGAASRQRRRRAKSTNRVRQQTWRRVARDEPACDGWVRSPDGLDVPHRLVVRRGLSPARGQPVPAGNGAGVRVRHDTGTRRAWTAGYRYQHISNGYRAEVNPGFDSNLFYVGFSIFR